jgi:hypothetical protein
MRLVTKQKSEENKKLSVNKQMQEVQESICENKATTQENENSETEDQERTEKDLKQHEKTGVLLKRPRRLPSRRNKDFFW